MYLVYLILYFKKINLNMLFSKNISQKKLKYYQRSSKKKENLNTTPTKQDKDLKTIRDQDFKSMENYIGNNLGVGIPSINNSNLFEEFYKYLKINFEDVEITFTLEFRYFLCCFIVLHIPSQYGFFFPKFFINFLPDNDTDNTDSESEEEGLDDILVDVVQSYIKDFKNFLKFVEEKKKDTLLIPVNFTIRTNYEFIKNIPKLIWDEPEELIKQIAKFDIYVEGFEEWKEINKDILK